MTEREKLYGRFECPFCGWVEKTIGLLAVHIKEQHPKVWFRIPKRLRRHLKSKSLMEYLYEIKQGYR